MRLARLGMLAVLALPALAWGQIPSSPECIVGIWDDPALTSSFGSIAVLEPKEVYVGVKLSGDIDSFTGVEFSIAGLNQNGLTLLGTTPLGARPLIFGTIPAPLDTTATSTGVGGVSAVWGAGCRASGEAIFKLVLMAGEQLSNRILQVKRSYPPSNPTWRATMLLRCDPPLYTAVSVTGGCYVLNPDGPSGCVDPANVTAVVPTNWTAMKALYR
jgi:hypothetical protein